MMNIAICEDNHFEIEKIRKILADWSEEENMPMTVYEFITAEQLLEANVKLEVLFLDVKLPGMHGDELAKKIRANNKQISIIFFTAYSEYMRAALGIHAFDYLEKPIESSKVKEVMNDLILSKPHEPCQELFLKTQNGISKFSTKNILYFEIVGRELFMYTNEEQIKVKPSRLKNIYEQVKSNRFMYCNQGCIVNLAHIKTFNSKEILMMDDSKKSLARSRKKDFEKSYSQYMKEKPRA